MSEQYKSQPSRPAPAQPKARTAERTAEQAVPEAIGLPPSATKAVPTPRKRPGLQLEEAVVTAGTAGETNIAVEKFWVEIEGNMPAGFVVTTTSGHGLDVTLEQRSYRKTFTGTSSLKTGLTPVAPIGTKGKLIVRDTTTGEVLEQPWTWTPIGSRSSLWALLKKLIWKG